MISLMKPLEAERIVEQRKKIGECLRRAREKNNLSYYKASKLSGLMNSQVKYMEDGERAFTIDNFLKLCQVYEMNPIDLLELTA